MSALVCPLCDGAVRAGSSGCLSCHLTVADIVRYDAAGRPTTGRSVGTRMFGLVVYPAAVGWCAYQLPGTLAFVVPAAVLAMVLHVVKGRPWVGLVVFVVVIAAVPLVFWPALGTDVFSDLANLTGRS